MNGIDNRQRKAVVAGHVSLDLTPSFRTDGQRSPAELFVPGKLLQTGKMHIHPGGVVSNTGLAMARLGTEVTLMGKIGADALGAMVEQCYRQQGVRTRMSVAAEAATSYTIVLAPPGVDRMFLHDPGPNDTFSLDDLDFEVIAAADLFHFGYPPLMKQMYKDGGSMLTEMYRLIDQMGVLTSLDMAAIDEQSEAADADWEAILGTVLPYVDFFLPSVEELYQMLDRDRYEALLEQADGAELTAVISVERDIRPLADQLQAAGAGVVLIKCGARGFYYRTAADLSRIEEKFGAALPGFAGQEGFERSYVPERILSATGAGDTTIAAFLAAMLAGYDFRRCIQLAAATGASCVAAYDSLSGLKSFAELEEKIRGGWKKQ